jgi:hypothetical protein
MSRLAVCPPTMSQFFRSKRPGSVDRKATVLGPVLLLAACSGGGGGGPPAPVVPEPLPRDAGTVVYATEGATRLFAVGDEGGPVQLLAGPMFSTIRQFSVSPDGMLVAYVADADTRDRYELYVASPTNGTPRRLSTLAASYDDVLDFRWSPGSDRLAYRVDGIVDEQVELHSVAVDGGGGYRVFGSSNPQLNVADEYGWSPDGRHLAFLVREGLSEPTRLQVHDAESQVPDQSQGPFVSTPRQITSFRFSSDGAWVALQVDAVEAGRFEVYRYSPEAGGQAIRSTGTLAVDEQVGDYEWSPNGRFIAQSIRRFPDASERVGLEVYDVDNRTSLRVVTAAQVGDFAWSPVGLTLAVAAAEVQAATGAPLRRLLLHDADKLATAAMPLGLVSDEALDHGRPAWSGDGSLVACATVAPGGWRLLLADAQRRFGVYAGDLDGRAIAAMQFSTAGNLIAVLQVEEAEATKPAEWSLLGSRGLRQWSSGTYSSFGTSRSVRWTSDGRRLIYSVGAAGLGPDMLRSVTFDGRDDLGLTPTPASASQPFEYSPRQLLR